MQLTTILHAVKVGEWTIRFHERSVKNNLHIRLANPMCKLFVDHAWNALNQNHAKNTLKKTTCTSSQLDAAIFAGSYVSIALNSSQTPTLRRVAFTSSFMPTT